MALPGLGLVSRCSAPVMSRIPKLHIEAFRARLMIMNSLRQIAPETVHDHETAQPGSGPAAAVAAHSGNVASITWQRTELTGPRGDLAKTGLAGGLAFLDLEDEVSYGREG